MTSPRLVPTVAVVAVLLVAAACTSSDDSASPGPEPSTSGSALPWICDQPADQPTSGEVTVEKINYLYNQRTLDNIQFEVYVKNTTNLAAWDARVTVQFLIDGEDVTNELDDEFFKFWPNGTQSADVPAHTTSLVNDVAVAPEYWEHKDVELKASVTVEGWCTPSPSWSESSEGTAE